MTIHRTSDDLCFILSPIGEKSVLFDLKFKEWLEDQGECEQMIEEAKQHVI